MPRVLIVEDEPAAARYVRSMIDLHSPHFSVVGTAGNGREALEQVALLRPDLVITDVKMPVMDGIALIAALKTDFPLMPAVIVSGHQEFDYVRRALDTGVVDYLLKPVNPSALAALLARIEERLAGREGAARAETLLRLVRGEAFDAAVASDERFWLAAARSGGLPSRFRYDGAAPERPSCREGFFVLPGRDSRERIYLGEMARLGFEPFAAAVRADHGGAEPSFRTVLISTEAPRAEQLQKTVRGISIELDALLVAGLSQVRCGRVKPAPEPEWDRGLADRIEFALREYRMDLLEAAVRSMAESWRALSRPLVAVESQLRGMLHFILRKTPQARGAALGNLELLLDDALAGIGSFDELADAAWSLAARIAGAEEADCRDPDVPAFFEAIRSHVEARYFEPLSLDSLSKTFRISSSYISKLFRKHVHRSFGEYLASFRIDAAKRLIRESPGMPLKDVAERVGFNDPFYFSRVFKSLAGLPPSDYSRQAKGDA